MTAHGVRASTLKHISIRRNRITATGAVALAIMIRDYPLVTDPSLPEATLTPSTSIQAQLNGHFEPGNSVTAREALQAPYVRKPIIAVSDLPSSPRKENGDSLDETKGKEGEVESERSIALAAQAERESWKNSEARTKLKKQISELPRTGNLLTLDVKDNEIRVSLDFTTVWVVKLTPSLGRDRLHLASTQEEPNAQGAEFERESNRRCWACLDRRCTG